MVAVDEAVYKLSSFPARKRKRKSCKLKVFLIISVALLAMVIEVYILDLAIREEKKGKKYVPCSHTFS